MDKLVIEQAQRALIQGDNIKARRILAEELVSDPRNEQLWLLLSQVVPPDKVRESLERVLLINPHNQEAREKLSALKPGNNLIENIETEAVLQPDKPVEVLYAVEEIIDRNQSVATEKNLIPLPITISEEEFNALFRSPSDDIVVDNQTKDNLGISKDAINEFNKQIDINVLNPASSLNVTEEELNALFSPESNEIKDEQSILESLRVKESGIENDDFDIKAVVPENNLSLTSTSLDVSEEELDALFKKMEQRSQMQGKASDVSNKGGSDGLFGQINHHQDNSSDASKIELDNLLNIGENLTQPEYISFPPKKEFTIGLDDVVPQKNAFILREENTELEPQKEPLGEPFGIISDQEDQVQDGNEANQLLDISSPIIDDDISASIPLTPQTTIPDQINELVVEKRSTDTTPVAIPEKTKEKRGETGAKRNYQKPKRIPRWLIILIGIPLVVCILLVAGTSWFYFYGPCGVENVASSTDYLSKTQARWEESMVIATNSSRVVLTEPLVKLEDIRQDVIDTKVPMCMESAKINMQNSMQATIEGYVSFLQYVGEDVIREKFNLASKEMSEYKRKMQIIQNCVPLCTLIQTDVPTQ